MNSQVIRGTTNTDTAAAGLSCDLFKKHPSKHLFNGGKGFRKELNKKEKVWVGNDRKLGRET